jgi:hypothetical protein
MTSSNRLSTLSKQSSTVTLAMGHLEYKMGVELARIQTKALLHKALLRFRWVIGPVVT